MTKTDIRREQIVDQLADFLLAEGLGAANLRPLGRALGSSDRMLLYYFKDKETLITAALRRAAARLADTLLAGSGRARQSPKKLARELLAMTTSSELWPYMCLWFEIAARAARGDPLYRSVGKQIASGFHAWIAARLSIEDDVGCSAAALSLLETLEGALLLKSVGLLETGLGVNATKKQRKNAQQFS
jgi:AcrR family transcriptional regulator